MAVDDDPILKQIKSFNDLKNLVGRRVSINAKEQYRLEGILRKNSDGSYEINSGDPEKDMGFITSGNFSALEPRVED